MSTYMCSCCHTEFEIPENIPLDAVFYDIDFDEGFLLCYNCAASMPVYFDDNEEYEPYTDTSEYDYYPDVAYGDYSYLMYAQ